MHRRLRSLAVLPLAAVACTPPIDPAWLITSPREIALDIQVIEQGPYGQPIEASARTPRDALPLDTLSLRPVVVDTDGPVDTESLDGMWVMCSGIANCLLRSPVKDRPICTTENIQPLEPCTFGSGSLATLTVGDIPRELVTETSTVFSLLNGPTVGFIASTPDGPGLASCIARLDAREPLEGCLLMERLLGIGPLGDLVETLESLGIDPGIDENAESLLARPRNHNPAALRFEIEFGGESTEVDAGARITVPRDEEIRLTLLTTEDDRDSYEALVGDQEVLFSDELGAQWWFDREIERLDERTAQLSTYLRVGNADGTVRAYVVIRDPVGGEGWGFVDLEFGG